MIENLEPSKDSNGKAVTEDYRALARASLVALRKELQPASRMDNLAGLHFVNLAAKIDKALAID